MNSVTVNGRKIGPGQLPYVIAEIGGNFETIEQAKMFIDAAMTTGADAVKMQTYKADTLASKKAMFDMPNTGKVSQYELFKKYELGEEIHKQIFDYAKKQGMTTFSTPSHPTDADLLDKLGVPAFKIGSDDGYNIPFIIDIAKRGKPVIISTGMCMMDEVKESVEAFLATGNKQLIVLHCVTQYPHEAKDANLRAMVTMQRELSKLGVPVGWSDHTADIAVCATAVALGAYVIEKHFTLDKNLPGPDHQLSASPSELKMLIDCIQEINSQVKEGMNEEERVEIAINVLGSNHEGAVRSSLGSPEKKPSEAEKITRMNNRKSIVAERDIPEGTIITDGMIAIKRPGTGIMPKHFGEIVGMKAKRNIEKEDVLQWEDLE